MQQRVIVAGLMNRGDEYLFIKQNKTDGAYGAMLVIPGGGIDGGEEPEEALRREFREETNIELKNVQAINFDSAIRPYKGGVEWQLFFLQYTAEYASGEPQAGDDASELIWLKKEDFKNNNINPAATKFLQDLGLYNAN